ncbi:MAG: dienelactone hydrolase family protein [Actinomycetota bacterium]|nr:dienelactone hydrolase family protein [Actinomycetota bacterium]
MTDVILFHHAIGLTDGVNDFADKLRAAGHTVNVPDFFDGATFQTIDEGVAYAESVGFEEIVARAIEAAEPIPLRVVYAGFSLGAMPAQKLAQTRPGALGALLFHGGDVPSSTFGTSWPESVGLQVHVSEGDEWLELDVAHELVAEAASGELFLYPGSAHLFTDSSLAEYEEEATALVLERTLGFLAERDFKGSA